MYFSIQIYIMGLTRHVNTLSDKGEKLEKLYTADQLTHGHETAGKVPVTLRK